MKVIDLINRCLNKDDTLPDEIIFDSKKYELHKTKNDKPYYYLGNGENFMENINLFSDLVDCEIEIIEEDKEIKELPPYKYEEEVSKLRLAEKINKLIKAVNELKKGGKK